VYEQQLVWTSFMGRIDENKKPDRMYTKTGCVGQHSSRFVHLSAVPIHIRLGILYIIYINYTPILCVCVVIICIYGNYKYYQEDNWPYYIIQRDWYIFSTPIIILPQQLRRDNCSWQPRYLLGFDCYNSLKQLVPIRLKITQPLNYYISYVVY